MGITFLVIHIAVRYSGPLFLLDFVLLLHPLYVEQFLALYKGITVYEVFAGMAIGLSMFLGYAFQAAGLQTIISSQSAFITALYVPMVPILQWIVFKNLPVLLVGLVLFLLLLVLYLFQDKSREVLIFQKAKF